ncbi:hypothetical protein [uncultured Roseobacter sp.]|uniref:hypothetical protein n=1 Tax=uncultured Roseobacter sp. TaxID=114847 RepID=UPI0026295FD9|nr:hypothetical protein [uncultured Roseobacter sp.]
MGEIPTDATHWDTGDWIDWHRNAQLPANPPCAAPSEDPRARLHTLHMRMLQCARAYFTLTGDHLPIYEDIAKVHAALAFDLPSESRLICNADNEPAQIITLAPNNPLNIVTVDLAKPFWCLIVVRINNNFVAEGRMMRRASLPDQREGTFEIHWRDLPTSN